MNCPTREDLNSWIIKQMSNWQLPFMFSDKNFAWVNFELTQRTLIVTMALSGPWTVPSAPQDWHNLPQPLGKEMEMGRQLTVLTQRAGTEMGFPSPSLTLATPSTFPSPCLVPPFPFPLPFLSSFPLYLSTVSSPLLRLAKTLPLCLGISLWTQIFCGAFPTHIDIYTLSVSPSVAPDRHKMLKPS